MLNLYISSSSVKDGKTFITAGLAITMQSLGYRTSVYKPFQTGGIEIKGFMQSPDLTYVKTLDPYIETHFTYLFKGTGDALTVSESEGNEIDLDFVFKDAKKFGLSSDCILLDGEGGILSPIAPGIQNIDLINKLQVPVLFVVSPNENSVNNTLLSIYAAENNGAVVNGVILNNIKDGKDNKHLTTLIRVIEEYSDAKVLGMVPNLGQKPNPEDIITGILNGVDIESVFNVKISKLELN